MGPAIPVALVCNLIDDTDPLDPICMQCCGTMCYKPPDDEGVGQPVEVTPTNDWGVWQGGLGLNPVDNAPIDLQTGEFVTFTIDGVPNFVDGQLQNSGMSLNGVNVFSSGGPTTRQIELSWDVALTGPFAFIIRNISPGAEDVPSIVPAPTSVTPDFTTGDATTDHQVYYDDITGIQSIIIDFETISFATGTIDLSLDETIAITSAASLVTNETIEIMVMANICDDPPTRRYFRMDTGAEILDPEIIENLYNCDIDYVEEEVCVTVNGEHFTCIKRTLYASPPVHDFIGPDGAIVEPDSWVPGQCDFQTLNGHILECDEENVYLEPASLAQFISAPIGTNQIIFTDEELADEVRRGIVEAQNYQAQQELHGIPVSSVIFNVGVNVYAFRPDALQEGVGTTLVIDEAGIVAWDADIEALIDSIVYTIFIDCVCKGVELLQFIKNSDEVFLSDVFDITYDPVTGQKTSILTDGLPNFNVLGPYAGPCSPNIETTEVVSWSEILCDRIDTVTALDLYSFNTTTQEVFKINALTGAVLDSHTPVGPVDWTNGTILDAANGFYYLYDTINGEFHRYDSNNIAAGNTNLGVFGGDPIAVGCCTFGAFDPTTGFGYLGTGESIRYRIDFNTLTVLSLAPISGTLGPPYAQTSSLSITDEGLHYITSYDGPSTRNAFYSLNPLTGVATFLGSEPGIQINGSDYDQDTLSGWYGVDANLNKLYRWTNANGTDISEVGDITNPGGTMAVGNASISTEYIEFQRIYHKDMETDVITFQDRDFDGELYEVLGIVETCPTEVDAGIETSCLDPLHVESCIVSWAERLCDYGPLEVLGEDQVFIEIAPQVNINQVSQLIGFSGGEGPVTGVAEAVFAVEPDVQYNYLAGHGGAGTCPGGPAAILVEIIDDGGAGAVLASQTLQYVGGVDPAGVDLGPTTMPFTSTTGNVMVRVSDQTPLTNICDAIFYWYDFQTTLPVATEFQRVYHKNRETGTITAQDHDFNGNLYTLVNTAVSCVTDTWSELLCDEDCVTFNRVYHKTLTGEVTFQDHQLDGTLYTPVGQIDICVPCCTVEAHLTDLGDGETWTPADIPLDHVLTGLSMNVQVEAADSSVTDADGNVTTNIPAGQSMSWNASADSNTLIPPQSIFAGTGGRIMLNITMRDET